MPIPVTQEPLAPITNTPSIGNTAQPQATKPTPPTTPQAHQQLTSQWLQFLSKPEVQAGLIQFGINALQPVPSGGTALGQIGRAIGAGGEAAGRVRNARKSEAENARQAGLAERKAKVAEEKLKVTREGIQATGKIASERNAAALQQQTQRDEAAGERLHNKLTVDLKLAKNSEDATLLKTIIDNANKNVQALNSTRMPGDPAQPAVTAADVLPQYFAIKQGMQGNGSLPSNLIDENVIVKSLVSNNAQERAQGEALLSRLSPAQRESITAKVVSQRSQIEAAPVKKQQVADRKSTRLNSSHIPLSRMPSSA